VTDLVGQKLEEEEEEPSVLQSIYLYVLSIHVLMLHHCKRWLKSELLDII